MQPLAMLTAWLRAEEVSSGTMSSISSIVLLITSAAATLTAGSGESPPIPR